MSRKIFGAPYLDVTAHSGPGGSRRLQFTALRAEGYASLDVGTVRELVPALVRWLDEEPAPRVAPLRTFDPSERCGVCGGGPVFHGSLNPHCGACLASVSPSWADTSGRAK